MARARYDILISGGGIAGLVAAAAFGHAGFSVLLADPAPPAAGAGDPRSDLRSTAFLPPARALFEQIGLWNDLAADAVPLEALRIADSTGWPPKITDTRIFRQTDLNRGALGWNLPNRRLHAVLVRAAEKQPNIDLAFGVGFAGMVTRSREALVTLTNGAGLRARLVIGADGRSSAVRDAVGIGVKTTRYSQKALAFIATHQTAHDNISTEIYNHGGAFTMVPLPNHDGKPASAIVWMNAGARTLELAAMPLADFNAEMTLRACAVLGPMERAGDLRVWPVITQRARQLTAQRTALVAEAAHVLPPIGAQGLNTSLQDVAELFDLAKHNSDALGATDFLDMYAQARERDIERRARAVDLFNRICKSGQPSLQALRRAGLKATHDIAPIRRKIMNAGLGQQ